MPDMSYGVRGHNSPLSITSQLSKIVNLIAMEVNVSYDHDAGHVDGDEHGGCLHHHHGRHPLLGCSVGQCVVPVVAVCRVTLPIFKQSSVLVHYWIST